MRRTWVRLRSCGFLLAIALGAQTPGPAWAGDGSPTLQLVESAPVETDLDHPDMADAHQVWLEMIRGARRSLDIEQFYVSSAPSSHMEAVLLAVEQAADRGVRVRLLADRGFHDRTYPESIDRLGARQGIEARLLDARELMGGVQHAKMMLVDGGEAFVGSQNFDWRSLEHNVELGLHIGEPALVEALQALFDADWAWAGGEAAASAESAPPSPAETWVGKFPVEVAYGDGSLAVTPVFSPTGWLIDEGLWDLPRLVERIDGATGTVRVQLMSYKTTDREGRYFGDLEAALRRAAARKVDVMLMVADWSKRRWTIEGLQSLQALPGITVKLVSLPPHSSGHIPYARVIHSKFMVVDDDRSWIGTANWGRDYFHASRNVGLLVDGQPFAADLIALFDELWKGQYAYEVDPGETYDPPRIGD